MIRPRPLHEPLAAIISAARVQCNPVEPRIERGLALETAQRTIRSDKNLLCQVFHLVPVPQEPADEAKHPFLVLDDQQLEGLGISRTNPPYQRAVTVAGLISRTCSTHIF